MEDPSSSQLEQKTQRTGRRGSKVVASNYGKQKGRETNNDIIYAPGGSRVQETHRLPEPLPLPLNFVLLSLDQKSRQGVSVGMSRPRLPMRKTATSQMRR